MGCFEGVRHWIGNAGLLHLVAQELLGLIDVHPAAIWKAGTFDPGVEPLVFESFDMAFGALLRTAVSTGGIKGRS